MEKIAIFGKGGIGKSTIAGNLSAVYAQRGLRVLHVGCDPKHDSTIGLVPGGLIETFLEKHNRAQRVRDNGPLGLRDILVRGRLGIDCIEAGGPEPGFGCAGRGVALMLETFESLAVLDAKRYDVVIFDVLGDIVCGGFAAPLRKGFAEKTVIVVSEELMALYAANNIAKSVKGYLPNGGCLAGLVVNRCDRGADRKVLERFAKVLGTRLLERLPRDPSVREAEFGRKVTAVEHSPHSKFAAGIRSLADKLLKLRAQECPVPTPMDDKTFNGGW